MSLIASTGPFHQPARLTKWLKHEYSIDFCREDAVLLAGDGDPRAVVSGEVLGLIPTGAQTVEVSAKAGNTGNGAIASATADEGAAKGRWTVTIIEAAENAGTFEVKNPKGKQDGTGNVGVAYDGGVNFTWADGAVDMAAGDVYYIDVSYAAGEAYVALDPAAKDGSQRAAAIAVNDATAPDGVDARVLVINGGPVMVDLNELTWPDGITAAQKVAAVAELRRLGIRQVPA